MGWQRVVGRRVSTVPGPLDLAGEPFSQQLDAGDTRLQECPAVEDRGGNHGQNHRGDTCQRHGAGHAAQQPSRLVGSALARLRCPGGHRRIGSRLLRESAGLQWSGHDVEPIEPGLFTRVSVWSLGT